MCNIVKSRTENLPDVLTRTAHERSSTASEYLRW